MQFLKEVSSDLGRALGNTSVQFWKPREVGFFAHYRVTIGNGKIFKIDNVKCVLQVRLGGIATQLWG